MCVCVCVQGSNINRMNEFECQKMMMIALLAILTESKTKICLGKYLQIIQVNRKLLKHVEKKMDIFFGVTLIEGENCKLEFRIIIMSLEKF